MASPPSDPAPTHLQGPLSHSATLITAEASPSTLSLPPTSLSSLPDHLLYRVLSHVEPLLDKPLSELAVLLDPFEWEQHVGAQLHRLAPRGLPSLMLISGVCHRWRTLLLESPLCRRVPWRALLGEGVVCGDHEQAGQGDSALCPGNGCSLDGCRWYAAHAALASCTQVRHKA